MGLTVKKRLESWQRRLTERIGTSIATPEARSAARLHYYMVDHGWLRVLWRNFSRVGEGVYRSNQPSAKRLREIHAKVGLRTVLNLRGASQQSFYLFEREECASLGLQLIDLPLSATQAPKKARLLELIKLLQSLPRPILLHCKSGADRTGLAAAVYLLVVEGKSVAEAQSQLSLRYTHVANSSAGVQDHLLRLYARAHARTGIGFADWVCNDYDEAALAASFARWRSGDRRLS